MNFKIRPWTAANEVAKTATVINGINQDVETCFDIYIPFTAKYNGHRIYSIKNINIIPASLGSRVTAITY